MTKSKSLLFVICGACMLGLVPMLIFFIRLGYYPDVPVEITDDKLYYLSRVREVLSGNIFIGNSYLLEHSKSTSMAFFVADWIYSIPFIIISKIGLSLSTSIVFSETLWSIVFSLLLFKLFLDLGVRKSFSVVSTLLILTSLLYFVLRPVTMSVVYPVFLIFLISYYSWFQNREGLRERIQAIFSIALCFYTYTYLWMLVVSVMLLDSAFSIFFEKKFRSNFWVGACSLVFISPFILYSLRQVGNEFYLETLERVGLVVTRSIGGAGFLYTFICLVVLLLAYFYCKKDLISKSQSHFFSIVSIALLFAGISNLITSKDLELAVHIGRFTDLFAFIFLFKILSFFDRKKLFIVQSLLLLVLLTYFANASYSTYKYSASPISLSTQSYKKILDKINSFDEGSVIMVNDDVSYYVPVMTKSYVLFSPNAGLNIVSNYEIEERYLVSRVFSNYSIDQIKLDFRKYSGVGNAVHASNVKNRGIKFCRALNFFINTSCPTPYTPVSLRGEAYFSDLNERYQIIKKDPHKFLKLYNVGYVVFENIDDGWRAPKFLEKIWSDGRYDLYKVNS